MRRIIVGILATLGAIAALAVAYVLFSLPAMRMRAREKSTEAQMHTVQLAAEDFGVQNDGVYAGDVDRSLTAHGQRLVDLLPLHERIWNAFTERKTEPRQGPAPAVAPPGSVWYEPVRDSSGAVVGYSIIGYGNKGRLDLVLRDAMHGADGGR